MGSATGQGMADFFFLICQNLPLAKMARPNLREERRSRNVTASPALTIRPPKTLHVPLKTDFSQSAASNFTHTPVDTPCSGPFQ